MLMTATQLPPLLRETPVPPKLLHIAGADDCLALPSIAVVGSRAMTPYGATVCRWLVEQCVRAGFAIVSGLATGIDAIAHETTLRQHGKTIAVLGSGLDEAVMFPAAHRALARRIIAGGGALVSEYPNQTVARRHHFIERNRILAGLSLATVIVEAAERSGAINTAHHTITVGGTDFFRITSVLTSHGISATVKRFANPTTDSQLPRIGRITC